MNSGSLCNPEGQFEIMPALFGREGAVVEGVGQEMMNQRAKSQPVCPAAREVV